MKDKAFARAVNRETLAASAEALDIPMAEHVEFVTKALADAVKMPRYQNIPLL